MRALWCVNFVLLLLLAGCNGKQAKQEREFGVQYGDTAMVNTVPEWEEADSTIYGYSDGFGQSAFTLITESGEEYDLSLTSSDAQAPYGQIYGDREDSAYYALTTRDNNEAVGVLINLSQLEKFTKNYSIYNGHLILEEGEKRDLVEIKELNDHVFRAEGKSGRIYEFKRKE